MGAWFKGRFSSYHRGSHAQGDIRGRDKRIVIGSRVHVLDIAECHPYWHDRQGTVIDTVQDDGRFYWEVQIDDHAVPVPFVEHEMEIL